MDGFSAYGNGFSRYVDGFAAHGNGFARYVDGFSAHGNGFSRYVDGFSAYGNGFSRRMAAANGWRQVMRSREYSANVTLAASQNVREKAYWLKKLPGDLKKSRFPYDREVEKTGAAPVEFEFPDKLCEDLLKLSNKADIRLFIILTAALLLLLNKYSGDRDLTVVAPITKQDVEGAFINTLLPIRSGLDGCMTFKEFLMQVGRDFYEATENQNYPIETLRPEPAGGDGCPLFETAVLLENIHDKRYVEHIGANMILCFRRADRRIRGRLELNSRLYEEATSRRIVLHLTTLLQQAAADVDVQEADLNILSAPEREQLLVDFNDTRTPYPAFCTIDELFEEQSAKNPDKMAVVWEAAALTYRELAGRAGSLAAYLRRVKGVGGEAVGIMCEYSLEMIVGILGILEAGAAYLPINADYPQERQRYLLADGGVDILLTHCPTAGKSKYKYAAAAVALDTPGIYRTPGPLERRHRHDSLAYIMYTSGSTGFPRGTLVAHRSVVRLVKNTDFIAFGQREREVRILQTGALEFDASTFEIWGALLNGLSLFLVSKNKLLLPRSLKAALGNYDITTMWLTAPLFNQMADADLEVFAGLAELIVGGDVLSPPHINRLRAQYPAVKIINGYGPTENTTFSTTHPVEKSYRQGIPIGKPIANSTAYILDSRHRLVPIGVVGELCVGGDGLCRGYLNNPLLTTEKFIKNPYRPGERVYRTGDFARLQSDGTIEFIGRIDHQIKIRGYRVEPGEIENRLLEIDFVREALIVDRQDGSGDKSLCAYLVLAPGHRLDGFNPRGWLAGRLPAYMVPAYFVQLERLPLTANQKIDYRALPDPAAAAAAPDYTAPADELEKKLADVWSEVLGIDRRTLSSEADFFELGGHSLKANAVITKVHKTLGVKVPIVEIFERPTIRELADYIRGAAKERFSPIKAVEKKEYYALSSAQRRLYVLQQMQAAATSYNVPLSVAIGEDLDRERVKTTFAGLIRRHESFRTGFERLGDRLVQRIYRPAEVHLEPEFYDLPNEPDRLTAGFVRAFDLSQPPLLRAGLIKTAGPAYILMIDMHHIVTDGLSMEIFIREFLALYRGETLPELRVQYKDFSQWQSSEVERGKIKRQQAFWLAEFAGDLPVLNLATDYPRPAVQSFEGHSERFMIPSEETERLRELAFAGRATLFMVLLSIYTILLSKLCGQEDIVVGIPVAGRRHADLKQVIGMFVNMLALRNCPAGGKSFREFLAEIREKVLKAFENQDYPFEDLVENVEVKRDTGRNPLFDAAFDLQDMGDLRLNDSPEEPPPHTPLNPISKFDMTFIGARAGDSLPFAVEYCTKLFRRESVRRFIGYFQRIVSTVSKQPDIEISAVEILAAEEREQLLSVLNNAGADYPAAKTIHQLFEEQARKTPAHVAVAAPDGSPLMTYRELDQRANRLAALLREKGVRPNTVVGLMLDRSAAMIAAILAVLKAGGAYLPLDPKYPGNRIRTMLDDSRAHILLSHSAAAAGHSFTNLQGIGFAEVRQSVTKLRPQVMDFDSLPLPDRSLVDYQEYNRYIGQAMVKNSISLQGTRGCPYHCAYCHKIWPRTHVVRSAGNFFAEVRLYYNMGVRRFVIIDDIFNLDKKNSARFFELIIENGLDVQLFFPNGLRGDLLTEEYIDLMVRAGTVSLALALETASPRLQKLIRKNLDLDRLRQNIAYFCRKYPQVILELFMMYGFPTETEQEAVMTLDFLQGLKWLHFPYFHVLKIYPHTDMEKLAVEQGVSRESIAASVELAYHELPDTLPFARSFMLKLQTQFLEDYFLNRERLLHVLPHQMRVLTEDEMVQKYNSYLPVEIKRFADILEFAGIEAGELEGVEFAPEAAFTVPDLNRKIREHFPPPERGDQAPQLKILLLDLSQLFSRQAHMLYDVVEPPLGLLYVLTYLQQRFGSRVRGRIAKSRIDFDSYGELKELLDEFKPDVIGIRTLTFYRDFFHRTAAMIRQWGVDVPIFTGGPYATSDYETILQDRNVDVVVLSEGELTAAELVDRVIRHGSKLPPDEVLREIDGIAFVPRQPKTGEETAREVVMLDAIEAESSGRAVGDPQIAGHPSDLAYLIFTSGSTGSPKGVMIGHKNVVRLMFNDRSPFDFNGSDVWTMFHSYCFDFSVWEMYGALLYGGKLVVVPRQAAVDPREYLEILQRNRVTVVNQTPTAFYNLIKEALSVEGIELEAIRYVIFGGEALNPLKLKEWRISYPQARLINMFGITETTVHVTFKELGEREIERGASPIGTPIPTLWGCVLDKDLQLRPSGVAGEFCVGGEGLARGYLNNPQQTAEKFVADPLWPGQRLYRSGDLVKFGADGELEYLGRIDQQVKVRGFRIELAEIEGQLLRHQHIEEAVVLARQSPEGACSLCAYIVWKPAAPTPAEEQPVSGLREYLLTHLPDYMIPAYFVPLAQMPLTPNGKIDRKALPEPEVEAGENYAAPRNEIEERLVQVWQEVLGVKTVGIKDNFFEIGGDSIKAIQIAARLRRHQLKIEIIDLLLNPTVEKLQGCVRTLAGEAGADQGIVEGQVALTPIQRWFFDNNFTHPHHYNQSVMLYRQAGFDRLLIEKVFSRLLEHHDALRAVYEVKGEAGEVTQRSRGAAGKLFDLEVMDMSGREDVEFALPQEANRLQGEIDLAEGPLVKLGLFKTGSGDHLLIVIHHLVIDGVSWRILLEDFAGGCRQLLAGEAVVFQEKTDSFKLWAQKLVEYAGSKELLMELSYWQAVLKSGLPRLPRDFSLKPAEKRYENIEAVVVQLNEEQTGKLLKEVNHAYNTEINDILLTGLGLTVKEWKGIDKVAVELEGHGREPIVEGVDVSRTIGWFTSQYPVVLDMNRAGDLSYIIKFVKETLRQVPNKGIGFGILKYLTPAEKRAGLAFGLEPEIGFNYLGQFGQEQDSGDEVFKFEMSPMNRGSEFSPELEWRHALDMNGMVIGGRLNVSILYNKQEYRRTSVEEFGNLLRSNLLKIIEHCRARKEKESTPSDLGHKKLSIEDLEKVKELINIF